ncbi:MAG TPA: hypothetical protein VJR71_16220 [Pseudolabrys sp.]|nr:hypothetical protein [Pseudolabrys sp.]
MVDAIEAERGALPMRRDSSEQRAFECEPADPAADGGRDSARPADEPSS